MNNPIAAVRLPASSRAGIGWLNMFALGLTFLLGFGANVSPRPTASPPAPRHNDNATLLSAPPSVYWPTIGLTPLVSGVSNPVHIANAADGSGRLFIVERAGRIKIVNNGVLQATAFLNITSRVGSSSSEQGLLSVAFPPSYASKGYFYVYYTNTGGSLVIARYQLTANGDVADPASESIILTVAHPGQSNHNGGQLAFGPDGYLYAGLGDGGGGGDPDNNAQNHNALLGKLLRIDVEGGTAPYAVPSSNPFVGSAGYRSEIWALGMRNPWRFGFDRQTGDLYVADVGQGAFEEVNYQPAAAAGGQNYGWRITEGTACYNAASCNTAGLTPPVTQYDHSLGCSISGGGVYRGLQYKRLLGIYLYADFCSGRIWGLVNSGSGWQSSQLYDAPFGISTFGEDENGEMYLADYTNNIIYRITDTTPTTTLVNAVLPTSRSVPVGTTATIYNSVINAGSLTAQGITLSMVNAPPGTFSYRQSNCANNALIGADNPVLDLPPGGTLCYVLSFTASAAFNATDVQIRAEAFNSSATTLLSGVNTWLLRATSNPGPDMVALTTTTDFHQIACSGSKNFAVALANVGAASAQVRATADTGAVTLPLTVTLNETNSATGAVIGDDILENIAAGEFRSVLVQVTFNGCVAFDPATRRVFIRFLDSDGNIVGSTSTAISTNR